MIRLATTRVFFLLLLFFSKSYKRKMCGTRLHTAGTFLAFQKRCVNIVKRACKNPFQPAVSCLLSVARPPTCFLHVLLPYVCVFECRSWAHCRLADEKVDSCLLVCFLFNFDRIFKRNVALQKRYLILQDRLHRMYNVHVFIHTHTLNKTLLIKNQFQKKQSSFITFALHKTRLKGDLSRTTRRHPFIAPNHFDRKRFDNRKNQKTRSDCLTLIYKKYSFSMPEYCIHVMNFIYTFYLTNIMLHIPRQQECAFDQSIYPKRFSTRCK